MNETVATHMARNVLTVQEDDPLSRAAELVLTRRIRHLPVLSGTDRLVGILTDRDIKKALPSPLFKPMPTDYELVFEQTPVSAVMTSDPLTVHPDAPLSEAIQLMVDNKIGAVPVVEESCLVGILTETDALRLCLEKLRGES
jgi:CBS domain-containing protein